MIYIILKLDNPKRWPIETCNPFLGIILLKVRLGYIRKSLAQQGLGTEGVMHKENVEALDDSLRGG